MLNSKHLSNSILIFSSIIGIILCNVINKNSEKPFIFVSKQNSSMNLDNKVFNYFHFGQKRLISSLLWVATILESDIEHYKGKNLNSWMFLRFDTISKLEPKFLETYNFGGPYLSIIKDDISGASKIYKSGLLIYPNNYQLLKNSAYHFYFEAMEYDFAKFVFNKLKNHPEVNPLLLTSLARIESSQGNIEDSFQVLWSIYLQIKDKNNDLAAKIYTFLYSIRAESDLECLNKNGKNCYKKDFNGDGYLVDKNGKYFSKQSWIPFRIKKK